MEVFHNSFSGSIEPKKTHDNSKYLDLNRNCACLSLRKAARAATQLYDHLLESSGVRATQFTLLVLLASVPSGKTLTEMAASLVMDRTTLTRNLKPLEKMGLISVATPLDKRSRAFALTDKGWETLEIGYPLWEKAQNMLGDSLGSEQFDSVLADLKRVTDKIIDM